MLTWEGSLPNSLVRRPPWLQACSVKNKQKIENISHFTCTYTIVKILPNWKYEFRLILTWFRQNQFNMILAFSSFNQGVGVILQAWFLFLFWLLHDFFLFWIAGSLSPSFIYIKMVDKLVFFANYEFISVLLSMCLAIWKLASWRKAGMKFCSRLSGALTCLVGAKRLELQKM